MTALALQSAVAPFPVQPSIQPRDEWPRAIKAKPPFTTLQRASRGPDAPEMVQEIDGEEGRLHLGLTASGEAIDSIEGGFGIEVAGWREWQEGGIEVVLPWIAEVRAAWQPLDERAESSLSIGISVSWILIREGLGEGELESRALFNRNLYGGSETGEPHGKVEIRPQALSRIRLPAHYFVRDSSVTQTLYLVAKMRVDVRGARVVSGIDLWATD